MFFGTCAAPAVLLVGVPRHRFSFSISSVLQGRCPDKEEVFKEEVETGEEADEEGDEVGEKQEEAVDNEELRSTVSARAFAGFSLCSILNSDQSKVLERPSRLRSRTRLLRGSEDGAEASAPAGWA